MTALPRTPPPFASFCSGLNVVVAGNEVIVLLDDGKPIKMSIAEAVLSGRRLLDAAEIAQGRVPRVGSRDAGQPAPGGLKINRLPSPL